MTSCRRPALRIAGWIQACGLLFILAGMLLAEGAAIWNFGARTLAEPAAGAVVRGAAAYLGLAIAGMVGLKRIYRKGGSRAFLWTALAASMLIQLAAIASSDRQWEWAGDARIFRHYLDRLSASGYAPETLGELSRNYDYPVWTRRALPFYYALRVGADAHFVRTTQFFQALLITLALVPTWRISKLLFGRRVAFWAVGLQCLMPFRWFICLDLNHYVLGGFYYLSALWVLVEWTHGKPGMVRKWGLALAAGLLLPLMNLEGGIGLLFLAGAFLALPLPWLAKQQTLRQTSLAAGALLAWPLLVAALLLAPLSNRIDRGNLHRLSGGTLAFMARGWMPETGGEYSATYERVDWLTPAADKKSMQAALLASQALYNPGPVLLRLPPAKLAKYFLLGYASGAEEMLQLNGAGHVVPWAKGARIAYLLAVLPLMIWGGILLLPLLRRIHRLFLVLPCSVFCIATVLAGETSPRYSFYVQPFLFMLGALPLAWRGQRGRLLLRSARIPGLAAAASWLGMLLLAAGLLWTSRPWLRNHALQDMREWKVTPPSGSSPLPATLAPFEIQLTSAGAAPAWGTIHLPLSAEQAADITFYLLPVAGLSASHGTPAILRRQTNRGPEEEKLVLPARVTLALNAGDSKSFELLSLSSPPPFPLKIGYARLHPLE